ncbi:Glucose oxidase [Venustampulla echinocandica]|uniref:Glucose oxidase n=1 Tax=Venustampulla echinocandica TaxID=2656787 RepID=A0A370TQL8_9HELO|nr:Glucose oxidase [Venustampulla echinocandica]RDL37825.1 Glucose oxidase [Venustampulla echinocandica]
MVLLEAAAVLLAVSSVSAWPTTSPYTNVKTRAEQIEAEYDYVIIGGGTSGLTVGDRLSENGKYSVLAIEYGYFDTQTGMNPKRMFNITSKPQPGLNDRTFPVGIGCVVGGSSCVNGQVFLRGTKEEYNAWETLGGGNSTWNWEGLLPYFKKGITLSPPEPVQAKNYNITYDMAYWGTTSKIFGTFGTNYLQPYIKVLYNAMKNMPGIAVPVDSGAGEPGLYWYPISQDPIKYERSYARSGHWDDLNRGNYEMLVGAKVTNILFDGTTATGVTFTSRNSSDTPPAQVKARRQVILAAGAVHTPQILMRSGIGPSPLLKDADIPVLVDLPGVGSNFQDHSYIRNIAYSWGTTPTDSDLDLELFNKPRDIIAARAPGGGAPSLAAMIGLPVVTPDKYEALAQAYESQDPAAYLPSNYEETQIEGYKQQQKVWAKLMRSTNPVFLEIMLHGPGGAIQNLHCMSRGTILMDPKDPDGEMQVDYRAASNPVDVDVMVEMIKFMRRYMTTGDLAQYEAKESLPGSNIITDSELAAWAKEQIIPSVYHPIGTAAKMPREWGGVVDEDLQVYGTTNLTIIDASIMPTIVGATTSMTVYAVAEKAADIIKARTGWD